MRRLPAILVLTLAALAVPGGLGVSQQAQAATTVTVSVGYADNLRPSGFFPTPWQGSPNTVFLGGGTSFDAGAIRLDNPTDVPLPVDSVTVDLQRPGPTFNLWGAFTIPARGSAVLTQTAEFNFDTSDFPIEPCGTVAPAGDPRIPQVTISIGGQTTSLLDTGHVLDTNGYDLACQSANESLQWRAIGGAPPGTAGGTITLAPPTQTRATGTTATVTATLLDAGGDPLPNVSVDFAVTSGPNAGTTGTGTTDFAGNAPFSYTSAVTGDDTVQASVTNASGATITSNPVTVRWGTAKRAGTFSCRASALAVRATLLSLEPVVANPADSPCANDHHTLLSVGPVLGVSAQALDAATTTTPNPLPTAGESVHADATVASLSVGLVPGHTIAVSTLDSHASVTCASSGGGLAPVLAGHSSVASVTIDGHTTVVGSAPLTLTVGPLATLFLNRTITSAGVVTQRALELDVLGLSAATVIAAEAKAGLSATPCQTTVVLP